ncbi:hypothetical protein AF38_04698 [Klebsiella pneumoniae MGH 52]|nr:hypothetical protein [Klebsiella pneumoniae]KDL14892.1 hypothetical protein AF38_04698 [Klebsiella pneumoniae MGH 52]
MPTQELIHLVEEGQFIESLTLYFYVIVLIIFIVFPFVAIRKLTQWSIILVLFTMMAREADLHKSINGMSILKLRFWTGEFPRQDKIVALIILLPIVLVCLNLLSCHGRRVLMAAKAHEGYAITLVTFVSLIIVTNIIDRSLGILKETLNWHGPGWLIALQTSQEEFLELRYLCWC